MVRRIWPQITVLPDRKKKDWMILKAVRFFTVEPEDIKEVRHVESKGKKKQLVKHLFTNVLVKKTECTVKKVKKIENNKIK